MGLLRISNRSRNLSVVFGLALLLVLASVLFAPSAFFPATVLGATTEVVQTLLPAPGNFNFEGSLPPASLMISAPSIVAPGQEFMVSVNITQVVNLAAYQLQISYDPSVIRVAGIEEGTSVTQGIIGPNAIPMLSWSFSPKGVQGVIKIMGSLWGSPGATGSGYLAQIHFAAFGLPGQTTNIGFTSAGGFQNLLVNDQALPIVQGSLSDSSVRIMDEIPGDSQLQGDANGDGKVNMGDVTRAELMIIGLAAPKPQADANGDGQVNMGDVTRIELIILGIQ